MTHNGDRDDLLTILIDEEGADDTRELQEPCATPNSIFSTLQKEYNGLLVNDTTVEYIKSSQSLHALQDHINHVKENQKLARTGRLWLMLMQIVAFIQMFIRKKRAYRKLVYSSQSHTGYGALLCCSWPQQLRKVL